MNIKPSTVIFIVLYPVNETKTVFQFPSPKKVINVEIAFDQMKKILVCPDQAWGHLYDI